MNNVIEQTESWQKLKVQAANKWSLSQLFFEDVQNKRVNTLSTTQLGIYADFSKQCINEEVLSDLFELAEQAELKQKITKLFAGDKVNKSENRAALHTALRLPQNATLKVGEQNVVEDVHISLTKVEQLVERIRNGIWRGFSGKAITDVINLGVGGSDLGPLMVTTALDELADMSIKTHFVSNMDGSQLEALLKKLNPETTLFIISSKSFSTLDTLSNAKTALTWLNQYAPQHSILRRHFIGISANLQKMTDWGIHPDNQLKFWEWVGGRFSLWSVIGLAIAIRIGMQNFYQLLAGAHAMDTHFATADMSDNLPVLMGLIGVWNSTFLNINAHTVLPYDGRLRFLPSYFTQLEMESNGKSVTDDGKAVSFSTCPILWGEVGSNAQHAFYQLLHQGTQSVSCDFIACVHRYDSDHHYNETLQQQQDLNLANCFAQSRVLAFGNDAIDKSGSEETEVDKFRLYRGNQPSTTLLLEELTAHNLGALIALYEHKVFVMASIWGVNPFDQWGVEMGKQVAMQVYEQMNANKEEQVGKLSEDKRQFQPIVAFDASTNNMLAYISELKHNKSEG